MNTEVERKNGIAREESQKLRMLAEELQQCQTRYDAADLSLKRKVAEFNDYVRSLEREP